MRDCPNQRRVLLNKDDYASTSSSSDSESEKSDDSKEDVVYCYPELNGVNLLVRKVQSKETETKGQRWSVTSI